MVADIILCIVFTAAGPDGKIVYEKREPASKYVLVERNERLLAPHLFMIQPCM